MWHQYKSIFKAQFRISIVVILGLSFAKMAIADETDNFFNRDKKLKDASPEINKLVNSYFKKALEAHNSKYKGCDKATLMPYLKFHLDSNSPEVFFDIDYSQEIQKSRSKAIYEGTLNVISCCATMLNVNGHLIGSDKIDHLFSGGFPNLLIYEKTKDIQDVLNFSHRKENGGWGLGLTQVKSYADIAADYKGLGLWQQMLDGENPYYKCVNGSFALNRSFDIREYVDDSMDEALNCSSFSSERVSNQVTKNMKKAGYNRCPVDPKKCDELVKKFEPSIAARILHPACRDTKNPKVSFVEKPGPEAGLPFLEAIERAIDGVQIKSLIKAVGGAAGIR